MSKHEKMHMAKAFSFELDHRDEPIVYERMVSRLTEIDLELAQTDAEKVGAPSPEKQSKQNHGKTAKGFSQMDSLPEILTMMLRRIAMLIADGYDSTSYNGIGTAIKTQPALPFTIAPKR